MGNGRRCSRCPAGWPGDGAPGEFLALGEVRPVQPLLEGVLHTVGLCEVEQAMGVEGVARPADVQAEREALAGRGGGDAVDHLLATVNVADKTVTKEELMKDEEEDALVSE